MEQKTISLDIQNCHLAKLYKDLGEHWNEKGIADFADLHIIRAGGRVAPQLNKVSAGIDPIHIYPA